MLEKDTCKREVGERMPEVSSLADEFREQCG